MEKRVPPSMRTRQALRERIEGRLASPDGRAELVKLATRLIVEEAGGGVPGRPRPRPLRAWRRDRTGYRNGVRAGRLRPAEGLINYAAPRVAGRDEPFRSEIRRHLKGRTEALEGQVVELLARSSAIGSVWSGFFGSKFQTSSPHKASKARITPEGD